jgi:dihydrofolate reductase
MREINAIAACSRNRVIGRDGKLPWRIPEDLRYFRDTIRGGTAIVGRASFEEVGRAFPGTETLVVSRSESFEGPRLTTARSLEDAIAAAESAPRPIWICGGQGIYEAAWDKITDFYVTVVDIEFEGDRFLPDWKEAFPVEYLLRETTASAGDLGDVNLRFLHVRRSE